MPYFSQLLGSNHSASRLLRAIFKSMARVWLILGKGLGKGYYFVRLYFADFCDSSANAIVFLLNYEQEVALIKIFLSQLPLILNKPDFASWLLLWFFGLQSG